jgi:hypothetical protein
MTLKELFDQEGKKPSPPSPKELWLHKVAKATGKKPSTVITWLYGYRQPDKASALLLERYFKTDIHKLIPNYNDKL